jgi:hypothetical protein
MSANIEFHERWGISCAAGQQLVSQEELCSIELV